MVISSYGEPVPLIRFVESREFVTLSIAPRLSSHWVDWSATLRAIGALPPRSLHGPFSFARVLHYSLPTRFPLAFRFESFESTAKRSQDRNSGRDSPSVKPTPLSLARTLGVWVGCIAGGHLLPGASISPLTISDWLATVLKSTPAEPSDVLCDTPQITTRRVSLLCASSWVTCSFEGHTERPLPVENRTRVIIEAKSEQHSVGPNTIIARFDRKNQLERGLLQLHSGKHTSAELEIARLCN